MLESKLEYNVNKLLTSKDGIKNKIYLDELGKLLLKLPYFKMLMDEYPDQDLGPLMFSNLLNHLIIQKYDANSIIWEYNDKVTGVYIIITGEIKIYKPPNKASLIRFKKLNQNGDILFFEKLRNKKTLKGKYTKASKKNIIFKKIESNSIKKYYRNNLYRNSFNKMNLIKKKQISKIKKCESCLCLNTDIKLEFNLNVINHNINQNIEYKEYGNEITLTEKNYIYREKINSREIDYIETFGKIIGEDCLIQNVKYRPYSAESLTKSILGFLTSHDYHILFDRINAIKKANIISFFYKVNYFNNKDNFIHKLYRGIKNLLYLKGQFIYKQNSPFRSMFIIKKGNVDIYVTKIIKVETEINSEIILGKKYKNAKNIKDLSEIEHFTNERFFELRGEYYEKKKISIINYGAGEILGNLEYFGKIKNYISSAYCLTNVEIYEIDINLYQKIESDDNFEFINKKTKNQLEYFRKRINEINNLFKRNKRNYLGLNKFMKAYCNNNPAIPLKEKEKDFINNSKNPIPIKIKLKNKKKLQKSIFSSFSSFDIINISSNEKNNLDIKYENNNRNNENNESPFITNNKEFTNNFNQTKNNRNNNNLDKKKEELLSLINSFNNNKNEVKTRNKRKFRTLSILNKNVKNVSKKPKKSIKHKKIEFDYSQVFASNEFSNFLSYYSSSISPINRPKDKRNTIINKKFKFNFHLSPRTDRKTVTNILVSKYNLINKNDIIKENLKDENEVDINLKNFKIQLGRQIAYHGYKVFLPRKIANLRDDQRFNFLKYKIGKKF